MADPPLSNGSVESNATLALLLRECADAVERNELSPVVYQTWGALNTFVKQNGGGTGVAKKKRVTKTTTRHIPAAEPDRSPETPSENVFSAEASAEFEENNSPFDESPPRQTHSSDSHNESSSHNERSSNNSLAHKSKDVFGLGGFSKKLGKQFGLNPTKNPTSESQKQATSRKNADRFKADLASEVSSAATDDSSPLASGTNKTTSSETLRTAASTASGTSAAPAKKDKPSFHRPSNPNSTLIANGWVEQQRRSKMRVVWKEVLASLVEGRTPQEETTLWIQRQITNAQGKPELEALHQIPMKWLESVAYMDFSTDHRFCVKVFNIAEDFQFRCADADSAQNWVLTLRSVSEIVRKQKPGLHDVNIREVVGNLNMDEWEGSAISSSQPERSNHRMTVRELQAIAHGAGYNTSGMERAELERLVTGIALQKTPSVDVDAEQRHKQQQEQEWQAQQEQEQVRRPPQDPEPSQHRRGISELRSMAHSAGYNTNGMERTELEGLVASLSMNEADAQPRRRPDPEPSQPRKTISELQSIAHGAGYNTSGMERAELERLVAKIDAEEASMQQQKDAALEAQRRRQQHQEEIHRKQEEERQRRLEAEMEQKRRQLDHERRRAAEAEQRKQQEEQRRLLEQHKQQQAAAAAAAAEQQRRQEEEMRRRVAEQQAAVERRQKQEAEEQRKRQEWQRSQWQAQQAAEAAKQRAEWEQKWKQQQQQQYAQPQPAYQGQQRTAQQTPPFHAAPPPQHQSYQPPPPQAPGYKPPPPPASGYNPPPAPPPPPQNHPASPADLKYAKMADQQSDDSQAAITNIKRHLLLNWALQPPMNQMLRPIDALITTIHTVFPPAFGVAGHEYFKKWTPIARDTIVSGPAMGGAPDDAKLKKAVRKLRFFLHPDKLPRDLNDEQSFMCKMLWDVISDAFEEFHKKNEELGWIHN